MTRIEKEKWMRSKKATHLEIDDDGTQSVVYHHTRVVSWRIVNDVTTVTLRTGGWMSATTKTRMNEAAHEYKFNFRVYQKKGAWFVWFPQSEREQPMPFAEIDPSDRPCMSCEALAQSAALCTGCRTELSRREIRTALATGTYMGKVIDIRKGKRS